LLVYLKLELRLSLRIAHGEVPRIRNASSIGIETEKIVSILPLFDLDSDWVGHFGNSDERLSF